MDVRRQDQEGREADNGTVEHPDKIVKVRVAWRRELSCKAAE